MQPPDKDRNDLADQAMDFIEKQFKSRNITWSAIQQVYPVESARLNRQMNEVDGIKDIVKFRSELRRWVQKVVIAADRARKALDSKKG